MQTFLPYAGQTAAMLAYDRPSPKLKAFLAKHYGQRGALVCRVPFSRQHHTAGIVSLSITLSCFKGSLFFGTGLASFVPQVNNYVVFNELLEAAEGAARQKSVARAVLKVCCPKLTALHFCLPRQRPSFSSLAYMHSAPCQATMSAHGRPGPCQLGA